MDIKNPATINNVMALIESVEFVERVVNKLEFSVNNAAERYFSNNMLNKPMPKEILA